MRIVSSRQNIAAVTDGLCRTAVNGVLWWLFLVGASIGKSKTSYGAYQMFTEADEALKDFNYSHFKQILSILSSKKLIARKKSRTQLDILITVAGRARLQQVLPTYRTHRPWDGGLYLISYDIAETHHKDRNFLREYLRRIGCALLQESLWVTPYNPSDLVQEFVDDRALVGTILVSKLGKDGTIGDEDLSSLLDRIYHLPDIQSRYQKFIEELKSRKFSLFQLSVRYCAILKDDPQLPFALLSKDWLGDRAYKMFTSFVRLQTTGR